MTTNFIRIVVEAYAAVAAQFGIRPLSVDTAVTQVTSRVLPGLI